MMRIILACLFVACAIYGASAQSAGDYTIAGNIKGVPDGTVFYLIGAAKNGRPDTVSRAVTKNEQFLFKGRLELPGDLCLIKIDTSIVKMSKNQRPWKRIFLGYANFKISGTLADWSNVQITGSAAQQEFAEMSAKFDVTMGKVAVLDRQILTGESDSLKIEALYKERSLAIAAQNRTYMDLINDHPNSEWTPSLIQKSKQMSLDEKKAAYGRLTDKAKQGKYGVQLRAFLGY